MCAAPSDAKLLDCFSGRRMTQSQHVNVAWSQKKKKSNIFQLRFDFLTLNSKPACGVSFLLVKRDFRSKKHPALHFRFLSGQSYYRYQVLHFFLQTFGLFNQISIYMLSFIPGDLK